MIQPTTHGDAVDDVIEGVLEGIEAVRPGLPLLRAWIPNPLAFGLIAWGVDMLYEGMVELRASRAHETPEEVRMRYADRVTASVQELAKAKFDAMVPDTLPPPADRETDPDVDKGGE